jgi:hypothetical protein
MAIGEGMLATGLQEYLKQYSQQFADFLFERYNEGEGSVVWSVQDTNEKLLRLSLAVKRNDSDGNPVFEDDFRLTIKIEKMAS